MTLENFAASFIALGSIEVLEIRYTRIYTKGFISGQLVMALCQYGMQNNVDGSDLIKYLYKTFTHYDSDTDPDEENSPVEPSFKGNLFL